MIYKFFTRRFVFCLVVTNTLSARIEYTGNPSQNFPIRWAFQELCDHHFDYRWVWETPRIDDKPVTFNPRDVQPGDLIFVRDAVAFFEEKASKIKVPYFILTHGEYLDKFDKDYFSYLGDKNILAWFTIHPCPVTHERVISLPLGIIQYKEMHDAKKKQAEKFLKLRNREKKKLVYCNFTCWMNPERQKLLDSFKKQPFCTFSEPCEFKDYISHLADHKFVLSPPGLGPDCYRVWESLLVGTIPIIEHSHMDSMYAGLPVLLIDDWKSITPEFLEDAYEEITSKSYSQEKLTMEYWIARIDAVRKKYWPASAESFRKVTAKKIG